MAVVVEDCEADHILFVLFSFSSPEIHPLVLLPGRFFPLGCCLGYLEVYLTIHYIWSIEYIVTWKALTAGLCRLIYLSKSFKQMEVTCPFQIRATRKFL
jgi:hypothetical protein